MTATRIRPEWSVPTTSVFSSTYLYVVDDCIVFRLQPDRDGDRAEVIASLDLEGKPAWERRFEFDTIAGFTPLAGSLYVDGKRALRLSAETGKTLAERDVGAPLSSYGTIKAGPVYFAEDLAKLMCLDAKTLDDVWEWEDPIGLWAAHDDLICRYDLDGTIQLVTLPQLKVVRKVQGPPQPGYGMTHGHVGELWCQTYDLERIGIDTRTGQTAWKKQEKDYRRHYLAQFLGEHAYSGDRDLSAYDMRNGELLWRQSFGKGTSWLSCRPHIEGDRIYGATQGGLVYVVDRTSGKVVSSFQVEFIPAVVRPMPGNRVVLASHEEIFCFPIP